VAQGVGPEFKPSTAKKKKKRERERKRDGLGMVVQVCNPSHSGGGDWEDHFEVRLGKKF
jgi:hypothetical protein